MKKYLISMLTALFAAGLLAGCASPASSVLQNRAQSDGPASVPNSAVLAPEPSLSRDEAYKMLMACKTEGYLQQSVADFEAALVSTPDDLSRLLAAQAKVGETLSRDDENYDFLTTTLRFSLDDLYLQSRKEAFSFYDSISKESGPYTELDDGVRVYEFSCCVGLYIYYAIPFPERLTVAERDDTFLTFRKELETCLNRLSEEEITGSNFRAAFTEKAAQLADGLSSENMTISCEIASVELFDSRPGAAAA